MNLLHEPGGSDPRPQSSASPPALPTLLACTVVTFAGLLVHFALTGAIADFVADALYAVLVYLVLSFAIPVAHYLPRLLPHLAALSRVRPIHVAASACSLCTAIELLQLSGGPALLAECFPPARLILGTTFATLDLFAYAVRVVAVTGSAYLLEAYRRWRMSRLDF